MKNGKIILIFTILVFAARLFATSTLHCSCVDKECGIMLHVNSEDGIADLIIVLNEKESYTYSAKDLDKKEILWETYKKPFNDNYLIVLCKGKGTSKPKFNLKVKGEKGKLIFKNRAYEIECDWRR